MIIDKWSEIVFVQAISAATTKEEQQCCHVITGSSNEAVVLRWPIRNIVASQNAAELCHDQPYRENGNDGHDLC